MVERRPEPRWLSGFRLSGLFLKATVGGSPFWGRSGTQLSSLLTSQTVVVGHGVVLAQLMMPLPDPKTYDFEKEVGRFDWLLHGSKLDVYEIHGGCGLSRKLLHIFSQITNCAARLQQDQKDRSTVVPMTAESTVPITAEYLLNELHWMRQWSRESQNTGLSHPDPSVLPRLRNRLKHNQITTSARMTAITGEAWRLAAILYLQFRVLRYAFLEYWQTPANVLKIKSPSGCS